MKNHYIVLLLCLALCTCSKESAENTGELSVTGRATEITNFSAKITCYANLTPDMGEVVIGVVYSTSASPSIGSGVDITSRELDVGNGYSVTLNGLSYSTTYYYRSYIEYGGIYRYGEVKSFKTKAITANSPAIDLGLSVKWSQLNLGASTLTDFGNYYAWGETKTKSSYTWLTYKWCNGSENTITKYCLTSSYGIVDNKMALDKEDDVAHIKLGGKWRMPTSDEWNELRSKCQHKEISLNGVNGMLYIGKNGNSIFLPGAGYVDSEEMYGKRSPYYWSSSQYMEYSGRPFGGPDWACCFIDCNGAPQINIFDRYRGCPVRPVFE